MNKDMGQKKENWFKQHADTLAILATFALCFWTVDGKIDALKDRFSCLEKDVSIIKTVLLMKNILPTELAKVEGEK